MNTLTDVLGRLRHRTAARAVLVINDRGDLVAGDAERHSPSAALRQLWINRLGGTEGLSRQIDTPDFGILVHDVSGDDVHVSTQQGTRPVRRVRPEPDAAGLGSSSFKGTS
jgi:hypothetical protein